MKAERAHRRARAHLSMVGSMKFASANIDEWASWIADTTTTPTLSEQTREEGAAQNLSSLSNNQQQQQQDQENKKKKKKKVGVLEHLSRPENFRDPNEMYGNTKLLLMYAFHELVEMAMGDDGRYV
jgi:hypothetical protein